MQFRKGIILVLISLSLLSPFVAFGQSPSRVLDQNQPNADTGVGGLAIGNGPLSEQKLAQIVTTVR